MNLFEKFYGKTGKELAEGMKELTLKKVTRGFGSTIDQLEEERINLEKKVIDTQIDIANGYTDSIISLGETLVEMNELNQLIATLENERESFIGE